MSPDSSESAERSVPAAPKLDPIWVSVLVTVLVAGLSYAVPIDYAATAVGGAFIVAVAWLVLRFDAETIRRYGLSLGGALEPSTLSWKRLAREAALAAAWALGLMAIIVVPFSFGFRLYWHPHHSFVFQLPPSIGDELLGQWLVIALPEEAFYRGYLMTALDLRWGTPWTIAGARLGWGWFASSGLFALGHVMTEPHVSRLAVFFPALVFGWLRARTGGIGASSVFHMLCNVLAATLTRGYGLTT